MYNSDNRYHKNFNDLPLQTFVSCLVTSNLNNLVISGNPSPDELQIAWDKIVAEFEETKKLNDVANIDIYTSIYQQMQQLEIQMSTYSNRILELLKFNYPCDLTDATDFLQDLRNVLSSSKEYFTLLIKFLENNSGYVVDPSKLSMAEYFQLIKTINPAT